MSLVLDASVALTRFVREDGAAPALARAEQANASFVTADSRLLERLADTPLAALAASLASFDPSRASPRP